jgi:hypothetical protein
VEPDAPGTVIQEVAVGKSIVTAGVEPEAWIWFSSNPAEGQPLGNVFVKVVVSL